MKKSIIIILAILLGIIIFTNMPGQLKYPLSKEDQDILRTFIKRELPNLVFDANWYDNFYFSTLFESADGYDITGNGAATSGVDPDGLVLNSGDTENDSVSFNKTPNPTGPGEIMNLLSFSQPQMVRTNFAIDSVANITAYITRGADIGVSYPYYGFKIVNATLKGVSRDNNTDGESTIDLMTISADTTYIVEARLLPNQKVLFYVVNNTTKKLEEKGVIITNIPKSSNTNNRAFFEYFVSTQEDVNKMLTSSFLEYTQKRNKY